MKIPLDFSPDDSSLTNHGKGREKIRKLLESFLNGEKGCWSKEGRDLSDVLEVQGLIH